MGMWSTFNQFLSVEGGIDGKSLKEKFLEDGVIELQPGKKNLYQFTAHKDSDVNFDCFVSETDNNCFDYCCYGYGNSDYAFLSGNKYYVYGLSAKYPNVKFHYHSSYCPGGGGERVTGDDFYVMNGKVVNK